MSSSLRVVVVGAGIIGVAVAEAIAKDGADVTLVDRSPPGSGATSAGMGHIVFSPTSQPLIALTSYSQRLWDELAPTLPAAAQRNVCGTIWVAASEQQAASLPDMQALYHRNGLSADVLTPKELTEAEPNLRPGLAGGLIVLGDSIVSPLPVLESLLDSFQRHGGNLKIGQPVIEMTGAIVRLADGSLLECDYAVNSTGAAAATLTPECGVRPRKGHLVITDRAPGFVNHQLVELGYMDSTHYTSEQAVAFNVQGRATGQVVIGSSREFSDSPEINHQILSRMLDRASEYMPGLASLSISRTWTGMRAAAPGDLPLIGPHPHDPRLILATGHEGLGLTTSLATARLIADLIAGREPAVAIEPYLPCRLIDAPDRVALEIAKNLGKTNWSKHLSDYRLPR